jgi:hypothetical protein
MALKVNGVKYNPMDVVLYMYLLYTTVIRLTFVRLSNFYGSAREPRKLYDFCPLDLHKS